MLQALMDPGNIYVIGTSLMAAFVAGVLFMAKRALEKNGEATTMTMKPIAAFLSVSAILAMAAVSRATIFADYYNTYSIYAPA
ncbi:MAG: hypothetical protein KAI73_00185 [Rhodospirillaceae bacterium]|nr:hypothetical protein [Rhodospirillaceae bacterium]